MSYFGTREQAKKDAEAGDMQIDNLMTTSPVRDGSTEAGAAPMGGTTEFTQTRTRTGIHDTQKSVRRSYGLDNPATPK